MTSRPAPEVGLTGTPRRSVPYFSAADFRTLTNSISVLVSPKIASCPSASGSSKNL